MIRVVTDSACDLSEEIVAAHDIEIVPLTIRLGEDTFLDRIELSTPSFWRRMRSTESLPETSAPSAGQFLEAYERLASQDADGIVVVSLSSRLSATHQAARVASEQMVSIPVRVIDSMNATTALGFQVLEAARAAAGGADLEQVAGAALDAVPKTNAFAVLDTLEFLRRGGRIGAAAAFFGTALRIKPMIELAGGAVIPAGRVRTRSKALAAVASRLANIGPSLEEVAIIHADAHEEAERLATRLESSCPISIAEIGPVIGAHTGPGTIGAAYRVR
ncbi:degV domain-containing protein [bacterium BMS3Abin02]|nr:degV domain-containing protein [bacterium BMS3Abin02]GBE21189.1 degV domain-containing protein [bacterium BMS3Bbin01]HDH27121.1 DegV family protein [Actinomycetota bacterium]HDK45727.1 DegV family protein [Actinomycetota bacterium]HDL48547.1 DegV family protein [Actinomycetota bacterium]